MRITKKIDCDYCETSYKLQHEEEDMPEVCPFCGTALILEPPIPSEE